MVNFDVISLWLPSRDGYVQIGETSRLPSLSAPRYPVPELGVTSIAGDGHTLDIHLRVNISNTEQTIGVIMEMENQFAFEYGMSLEEFLRTAAEKKHVQYIRSSTILQPTCVEAMSSNIPVRYWMNSNSDLEFCQKNCQSILGYFDTFIKSVNF